MSMDFFLMITEMLYPEKGKSKKEHYYIKIYNFSYILTLLHLTFILFIYSCYNLIFSNSIILNNIIIIFNFVFNNNILNIIIIFLHLILPHPFRQFLSPLLYQYHFATCFTYSLYSFLFSKFSSLTTFSFHPSFIFLLQKFILQSFFNILLNS